MVKRRYIATVPSAVFGVGPFIRDVKEQLMDFGLTGEALGMWRGIVLAAAVGITLWALWPDICRVWVRICDGLFRRTKNHKQQLLELREIAESLPLKPLGDGHQCAALPDGTNIVVMKDGTLRLAIPKRIRATATGTVSGVMSASIVVRKADDDG